MMKIKNKQFFNRKILMTLVVGTNVILGGTAVYAEEPQKFTLDEYVVTATRTELSRKEVPQSVEVITKEDIQNIGATNVIDALRTATNIEIPEAAGRRSAESWFPLMIKVGIRLVESSVRNASKT